MPPSGTYPDVTAFAKVTISGVTFQWDSPNQRPVRPKPVMISSAMSSTSWRVQMSRTSGQ